MANGAQLPRPSIISTAIIESSNNSINSSGHRRP
jgi:hypothetical protein